MFTTQNLLINRGRTTSNANGGDLVTVTHAYKDTEATVANIIMSFPDYLSQGSNQDVIFVGDHILIKGSDTTYFSPVLSLAPFTVGPDLFSNSSSNLSVGAPAAATDGNAAKITGDVLQMQVADATHPGILTNISQDIGGEKTFHADVNISEPATGLLIEKETGDFGVSFVTNADAAEVSLDFVRTGDADNDFEITYSYEGFLFGDPIPQMGIFAKRYPPAPGFYNDRVILIDNNGNGLARVMLHNAELYVDEIFSTFGPDENVQINGWTINNYSIKFPTPLAYGGIDLHGIYPNAITYEFAEGDHFAYDTTTDTFFWTIDYVIQLAIDATSGIQSDIGFDRVTAGNLNIGPNNATGISLLQHTELPVGKILTANGGIVFGGGGANLNYYTTGSFPATTWTNGAEVTANSNLSSTRVGEMITISLRAPITTPSQVTPGAFFINNTALTAELRPNLNKETFVKILNGTTPSVGYAILDTSGFIRVYANIDLTTTFSAGMDNTISYFEFTYTLSSP